MNNWQEEDKDITELLLELSEEENRMLRWENQSLRKLIKRQEQNYQNLIERIEDSFLIERRYN